MNAIGTFVARIPKPLRDFAEGCIAAAVAGASSAVLAANLGDATAKQLVGIALVGAVGAVIAYARRGLPVAPAA